jgi:hypothetical protein
MQHSGKNPNKTEGQWFHDVADICGCICCLLDGHPRDHSEQAHVSIHHCDGRTKAHAHYYVLPLCAGHHQQGTGPNPNMLAVHGHKARWIAEYGREIELVEACARLVATSGRVVPDGVHALLAKWYESEQYSSATKEAAA